MPLFQRTKRPFSFRTTIFSLVPALAIAAFCAFTAGCIEQKCFENNDCPAPKICQSTGTCGYECVAKTDCGTGFTCHKNRCQPLPPDTQNPAGPNGTDSGEIPVVYTCPDDMANVDGLFCMDRYEASRPDATSLSYGTDESRAVSAPDVYPWQVWDNATAEAACNAAEKRLCTPTEWQYACQGTERLNYAYGNIYHATICNGIDAFGYPRFHLMPTGSFPECVNEWGIFDLNGNLWEHTANGSNMTIRGGAYNCGNSALLHRCDYVPGNWEPSARGFRCCAQLVAQAAPNAPPSTDSAPLGTAAPQPDDTARLDTAPPGCIAGPVATGTAPVDTGTEPFDTGTAPVDTGTEPVDTGTAPVDTGTAPVDTGTDPGTGCPADMVPIDTYCIDIYEASRCDATRTSYGSDTRACSRPGVMPWYTYSNQTEGSGLSLATARAACATAGKRLCRADEWFEACQGPQKHVYCFGDTYNPTTCNGLDTFCRCSSANCAHLAQCPYPYCHNYASTYEQGGPCGADLHITPTGDFPGCVSGYGVYDISGNLWELVDNIDGKRHFRGGAFNCNNSMLNQRCDYDDITWIPSAHGFRCCKDRDTVTP